MKANTTVHLEQTDNRSCVWSFRDVVRQISIFLTQCFWSRPRQPQKKRTTTAPFYAHYSTVHSMSPTVSRFFPNFHMRLVTSLTNIQCHVDSLNIALASTLELSFVSIHPRESFPRPTKSLPGRRTGRRRPAKRPYTQPTRFESC